jgi:hypothetical protein
VGTTPKDLTSAERASPSTIAEPVEQPDLATVIKVSQALTGEMVLDEQNMALANLLAAFAEMDRARQPDDYCNWIVAHAQDPCAPIANRTGEARDGIDRVGCGQIRLISQLTQRAIVIK